MPVWGSEWPTEEPGLDRGPSGTPKPDAGIGSSAVWGVGDPIAQYLGCPPSNLDRGK